MIGCSLESEVLSAVLEGCWTEQLREHVSGCVICTEVAAVAGAFKCSREAVVVPDVSRVWWLAQLKTRREAAKSATTPIVAAQIAAFIWAVGLLVVCGGVVVSWFHHSS
jgi:hypothetical protein